MRLFPHRLLLGLFFSSGLAQDGMSQNSSTNFYSAKKEKSILSLNAGVQHGFIFAHSPAVENTKGAHPTGIELSLGWQRNDSSIWNLCNCFPVKGLLLSYYDYDAKVLGKSIGASYFLEPSYRLGNRAFFSFKGAAGLAYLTNPYDSVHNPTNMSYSTAISGYLLIGIGLWIRINDHWWLNGSVNYQHMSNGGLREPNKGINWPTAGVALRYNKNPRPYYTGPQTRERFWKEYTVRWDAGIFGVARRVLDKNGNSHRMPLIGINFQGSKQVGRINALTLGSEIYFDKALHQKLKRDTIDASAIRAGLLVGHEFLLGKFLFSQQIGVFVFNQVPDFDRIYHRWGLHYRISKHWGVGFNLQAHRHIADFVDIRVIYSWQKIGNR